ncbi:hypothetical protein J14TS5_57330 [Paenibacillus lautus]|nr:hypothetical protein J14TS5_57330 [Paenibacillus lautus]
MKREDPFTLFRGTGPRTIRRFAWTSRDKLLFLLIAVWYVVLKFISAALSDKKRKQDEYDENHYTGVR